MSHVIVSKEVGSALWPIVGERAAVIAVLTNLHNDLAPYAAGSTKTRDRDDPDQFLYRVGVFTRGGWCEVVFWVNDVRAPGYLFVEAVSRVP